MLLYLSFQFRCHLPREILPEHPIYSLSWSYCNFLQSSSYSLIFFCYLFDQAETKCLRSKNLSGLVSSRCSLIICSMHINNCFIVALHMENRVQVIFEQHSSWESTFLSETGLMIAWGEGNKERNGWRKVRKKSKIALWDSIHVFIKD